MLTETLPDEEQWQQRFLAAPSAGKPLGSRAFVKKLEAQTGQKLEQRGRERPRKEGKACSAIAGDQS